MATIKLKDESSKTFSIDGVCYTKGDYRLQYNAKKEVLIIPKAVANISNLSGLPFKNPTAWTYFVDLNDDPYGSFEEFSLAISDAINFNSGEAAPTLQEVTDNGSVTTNEIKTGGLITIGGINSGIVIFNDAEDSDNILGVLTANQDITTSKNWVLPNESGTIALLPIIENDFADDSAAATGGIAVGSLYHTSGVVKIRLS